MTAAWEEHKRRAGIVLRGGFYLLAVIAAIAITQPIEPDIWKILFGLAFVAAPYILKLGIAALIWVWGPKIIDRVTSSCASMPPSCLARRRYEDKLRHARELHHRDRAALAGARPVPAQRGQDAAVRICVRSGGGDRVRAQALAGGGGAMRKLKCLMLAAMLAFVAVPVRADGVNWQFIVNSNLDDVYAIELGETLEIGTAPNGNRTVMVWSCHIGHPDNNIANAARKCFNNKYLVYIDCTANGFMMGGMSAVQNIPPGSLAAKTLQMACAVRR
jgi:hypothetical protein